MGDAAKKVKGRKRHIVVDTLGLVGGRLVHEANISERDGAKLLLWHCWEAVKGVLKVFADGGYSGEKFNFYMLEYFDMLVEVVKRTGKGFQVLPKRWVVERTFAWLDGCRRLSKDYEFSIQSSQGFLDLACLQLCVRRLPA